MEVTKKKCKIKLMAKREVQFFEWQKESVSFFDGQKGISPLIFHKLFTLSYDIFTASNRVYFFLRTTLYLLRK
jgi:hypothetical protein